MAYNPYGYGNYQNPYQYNGGYYNQQNLYQNQMQQMQQAQPVQMQQNFIPLTFTNGFIGAKAYTMMYPNSTIYLQDSESDRLFIKKSDAQGKCTLETYRLVKEETDENGNTIGEIKQKEIPQDYITKADLVNFASKSDFYAFRESLIEMMNNLSTEIKTNVKSNFSNNKPKENNYNKKGR